MGWGGLQVFTGWVLYGPHGNEGLSSLLKQHQQSSSKEQSLNLLNLFLLEGPEVWAPVLCRACHWQKTQIRGLHGSHEVDECALSSTGVLASEHLSWCHNAQAPSLAGRMSRGKTRLFIGFVCRDDIDSILGFTRPGSFDIGSYQPKPRSSKSTTLQGKKERNICLKLKLLPGQIESALVALGLQSPGGSNCSRQTGGGMEMYLCLVL